MKIKSKDIVVGKITRVKISKNEYWEMYWTRKEITKKEIKLMFRIDNEKNICEAK